MAEFTIDAADIAAVLRKNVEGFHPSIESEQVGRVLEVGDGIARVAGLPNAAVNELLEFEGGALGLALNLEEDNIGAVVLGKADEVEEGQLVTATGRILSIPVGNALLGRVVNALGVAIDGHGPIPQRRGPPARDPGARHHGPQARARAAADRHQGDRRDDADRARPARAHHRRPQDRQDHGRDRHDPEPKGSGREVHLRGDRAEGLHGRADGRDAARARCARVHGGGERAGLRRSRVQVPRALLRLRDGSALDGARRSRAGRVRRPLEAGRGLPADRVAAPPPAGPRGVPRRRLLSPQPAARARGQAERRSRRRLAHGPADHRDQGRRRVGVHPHQRDLDHRRPDLPRRRPLQVGGAARRRRRHLGVACGWRRADQGDEVGVGNAEARPRAVP